MTWLAAFCAAYVAEFAADLLSAYYQTSVRKLQRRKAVQWGLLLGMLGWVDLGGIAAGLPLSALFLGSVLGGATGTWVAVGRLSIKARMKKKRQQVEAEEKRSGAVQE